MPKSPPLAKNEAFISAMEKALAGRRESNAADDGVWMFFKNLTLREGGNCQNLHEIAVTAAKFFDQRLSAGAPSVTASRNTPEEERILAQFSKQELSAIEQVATSKPQRHVRGTRILQAGVVATLSLGSIGLGAWRQAGHDRAAEQTAAEQTAAYRVEHPDDPITIPPQFETLCPAPHILGGVGLLYAAALLMLAHEIGQAIKRTDAQSQADYETIITQAFARAETHMREEGRGRGGRG